MRPTYTRIRLQPDGRRPTILKFGGASVADAHGFERVRQIVREQRRRWPVVVVSAMSRVTDALLESFRTARSGETAHAERLVEEIYARHLSAARELLSSAYETYAQEIGAAREEISALLREAAASRTASPALEDLLVSYGERLSASLLAAALRDNGLPAEQIDARRCIVTDSNHGEAAPLLEESERRTRAALAPLLNAHAIPVLGGFIGMSEDGATTTLGRNGSDYTASIVGSALNAREIQIWTDVAGVLTAEPRLVKGARTVPLLSYAEAAEMAHFGAKVLHHKMIQPAARRRIPVRVRNTFDRGAAGTIVCSRGGQPTTRIKAIAHRTGLVVLRVASAQPAVSALPVTALFRALSRHRLEVYAASASAAGVTFVIDEAALPPALAEELSGMAVVSMLDRCAGVCIIGGGLDSTADVLKQLREASDEPGRVLAALLTCNNNLILAVAGAPVDGIVKRLHSVFIEESALARRTSGEETSTRPMG